MNKIKGKLIHHVYFWLKDPNNSFVRNQFKTAIENLRKIENIDQSHFGKPATTKNRKVVDHSYTFSLMLLFNSKKDQDLYQLHPEHSKFVKENESLWYKVIVYDTVDELL